jgi:hypothetical protein
MMINLLRMDLVEIWYFTKNDFIKPEGLLLL